MKKLKLFLAKKHEKKGQSLIEMSIVLTALLVLALGAVEFGYLLNQYINLVDGTREGARYASNQDPYAIEDAYTGNITYDYSQVQPIFFTSIDDVVDGGDVTGPNRGAIAPLKLNPATDEVMIYFLSIRSGPSYITSEIWCKFSCASTKHPKSEALINSDPAFIKNSLSSKAPNTGLVVVEVFYSYNQLLSLPIFTALIPDPINVHAYSIMPLSAAEPTPVVQAKPDPFAQ